MKQPSRGEKVHPTTETVKIRFAEAGLVLPDEYLTEIAQNLIVLQNHAATLNPFDYETANQPHG